MGRQAADRQGKRRVVILGGGPSALAAAFELTATPELEQAHEITIYQPGWRLGGKCASGRNRDHGFRIEEHGLHIWFGCYDNAFSIMRRCYAELDRDRERDALPTWYAAFQPCHEVVVWSRDTRWDAHRLRFPPTPDRPGGEARRRGFLDVVREVLAWIDGRLRELEASDPAVAAALRDAPAPAEDVLPGVCADLGLAVERPEHLGRAYLLEAASLLAERHVDRALRGASGATHDLARAVDLLDELRRSLRGGVVAAVPGNAELRFVVTTADLALAAIAGILVERLLFRGFDAINDVELSEWLRRNGADIDEQDPERNSPFLRAVYDGSFAFLDGDRRRPHMAAGRALQGAIRCLFHYKGAVLWRMQTGMGDAVVAPLYEVLAARGVRFAFFHAAEELRPSSDGRDVAEISIVAQVGVKGDGAYRPLITCAHDGRRLPCWPDRPLFEQLEGGRSRRVRTADFEHDVNPLAVTDRVTLRAGEDFDVAILAVPPPVQQQICRPLADRSRDYERMLNAVDRTVVTQAVQLWLDRTPEQVGWCYDSNSLMSTYVEPLDTYCDMSHLLASEDWPRGRRPRHIAYFCGVIAEQEARHAAAAAIAVRSSATRFLEQDAARFWPAAAAAGGDGFDWDVLLAPAAARGADRLDSQYMRVNHQPAERYVLTPTGTVSERRWPSQRFFRNLVLAGDWTRNGFDAGCVEAAMTSGMLAAQAIAPGRAATAIAGVDGPPGFPNRPPDATDVREQLLRVLLGGADRFTRFVTVSVTRLQAFGRGAPARRRPGP